MRLTSISAAIFLLSGCAAIGEAPPHVATAASDRAVPTIVRKDEGEKLLMSGDRYVLLKATSEGAGAKELFMGTEAIPPGRAIPVHSHDGYEEIIFIHEGDVQLTLGDMKVLAEPGTTMFVPRTQ